MAEASLAFLLESVKQLVLNHVDLHSKAKSELDLLEVELKSMKSILEEASRKPRKEEQFKAWERRIREVVYEAEDAIDSCVTHAAQPVMSRILSSTSLAEVVRSLRERKVKPVFEKAITDFANLPIAEAPGRGADDDLRDRRNKAPRQDNVVGFEDEIQKLVGYIIDDKPEQLDVISIIGMPGLGKTTVAWKLYHHPQVQYEFPIIIWVYVSQDFNKKDLLLNIMKKFTKQDLSSKPVDELSSMVLENLKSGKFLIFMDDVWTVDAWDQIKEILPQGDSIGKVLITSRSDKVAWRANRNRGPHKLRFLTQKESWELLQIEVFGKLEDFPQELETVGKLIAHQCGGLPLAIVVIGGILADKRATIGGNFAVETEWQKVSDSVQTHLVQADEEKRMEKFISLSYTTLPYHLRDCFLYMGMFPEDAEIPAWKLTQMWIAEGFVLQKREKSMEEAAHDNLKDLIDRNLVQVDTIRPNGEVKSCRLHDTIREFCKNEAGLESQNLFQEIRKSKQGVLEPSIQKIKQNRRLCIHSYIDEFLSVLDKHKIPKARSLLCFSKEPIILDSKDVPTIINASGMLRVLEISTIKFPKFPSKIVQLIHLRYITLSGDQFKILPDVISKLWNLHTIIVVTLTRQLDVKANIWKMPQLRHFKTKALVVLKCDKGDGGENLQTLTKLAPQSCTANVFKRAKNLSSLGIRGDLSTLPDTKVLGTLSRLENLKLVHDVYPKLSAEYPWRNLPQPDIFPPCLKYLTLSKTYLDWKQMSNVGGLHSLEVLKLKENAFQGRCWEAADRASFDSLRFLSIERTDLVVWQAAPSSFPKLKSLVLKNCEKLEAVPSQVGENLEMLYLERVSKSVATSAREIEKKKQQVAEKQGSNMIAGFKLVIRPGVET